MKKINTSTKLNKYIRKITGGDTRKIVEISLITHVPYQTIYGWLTNHSSGTEYMYELFKFYYENHKLNKN